MAKSEDKGQAKLIPDSDRSGEGSVDTIWTKDIYWILMRIRLF